jgi:hypothetical protein
MMNAILYSLYGLSAALFCVSAIRSRRRHALTGAAFAIFALGARIVRDSDGPDALAWSLDIAAVVAAIALAVLIRRTAQTDR